MSLKDRLLAALTSDWKAQAEIHLRQGDPRKAAEAYARGGSPRQAAKVALESGDGRLAAEYVLRAAFGEVPPGLASAGAGRAAEYLFAHRRFADALPLFELAGAWKRAAEASVALAQPQHAARCYEKARLFEAAAGQYERAGLAGEALRALDLEADRLRAGAATTRDGDSERGLAEIDRRRHDLRSRTGLRHEPPSSPVAPGGGAPVEAARALERGGRLREAIEAYVAAGDPQDAVRLLRSTTTLDGRTKARLLLLAGNAIEAAPLFVAAGSPIEAAEAFEAAGAASEAAAQWEVAGDPRRAAIAWRRAARWRDAGRCFDAADDPASAAECHARGGDTRAAAAALERAGRPLEAAARLLEADERPEAIRILRGLPATGRDGERATLLLVSALVEAGQTDEAMTRLATLPSPAAGARDAIERLYWQGRIHERRTEREPALVCYQKVATLDPGFKDVARRLTAVRAAAARASSASIPAGPPSSPSGRPTTATPPADPPPAAAPRPTIDESRERMAETRLIPGALLAGRYEIEAEIGRGGMGRVFRARDRERDGIVAVKTLAGHEEGPEEEARLAREAEICRRLDHPNIVRVFDFGRVPGGHFVAMEYLEGQRLDDLLQVDAKLPLARVRYILTEVAAGLAAAHALQIVHRDLKPGNLMITADHVKILDFGIARHVDGESRVTRTGLAVGTPLYMSPEQLRGDAVDERADLYALGVLTFALVAGREPFLGENVTAIALGHLRSEPPDLRDFRPDLPVDWVYFVNTLLAKRPEDRYQSALAALETARHLPI